MSLNTYQLVFWLITLIVGAGMTIISFFLRQLHDDLKDAIAKLVVVSGELQILYERLNHAREANLQELSGLKEELIYLKNGVNDHKIKSENTHIEVDNRLRELEKDVAILKR